MPRYMVWEQLPDYVKSLSPEELTAVLDAKGIQLIDTSPPTGGLAGRRLMQENETPVKTVTPRGKGGATWGALGVPTTPEIESTMRKVAAGMASTAAGGGGPVGVGLAGALASKFGQEPTSGRGIADMLTNVVAGRLNPIVQGGQALKNSPALRDFLLNFSTTAAGQAGGQALAEVKGETKPISFQDSLLTAGGSGLAGAVLPMIGGAAARAIQAGYDKTPQAVRAKVAPYLEKLKAMGAPIPAAAEELPVPPVATPKPALAQEIMAAKPAAPVAAPVKVVGQNTPPMSSTMAERGVDPRARDFAYIKSEMGDQWEPFITDFAKRVGVEIPEAERLIGQQVRSGALKYEQLGIKPQRIDQRPASPLPGQGLSLEEQLAGSLKPKAPVTAQDIVEAKPTAPIVAPKPALPQPTSNVGGKVASEAELPIDPLTERLFDIRAASNKTKNGIMLSRERRYATEGETELLDGLRENKAQFLDKVVDDLPKLPERLKASESLFPNGEFRKAVQQKMLGRVLSGIGEEGAQFDLAPLQAIKKFGGQDFGDKKGVDIINQTFGSQDAYRNLEAIHDSVASTMTGAGSPGWKDHVKVFWSGGGIGTSLSAIGLSGYTHDPKWMGLVIAIPLASEGTRVVRLGAEKVGELIGKNSRWAEYLRDAAEGVQRRGGPSINQVISYIRRNADSDELVSAEPTVP